MINAELCGQNSSYALGENISRKTEKCSDMTAMHCECTEVNI